MMQVDNTFKKTKNGVINTNDDDFEKYKMLRERSKQHTFVVDTLKKITSDLEVVKKDLRYIKNKIDSEEK